MGIHYDAQRRLFHLQSLDTSYVIQLVGAGYPAHLYWGKRMRSLQPERLLELKERPSFTPSTDPTRPELSLDTLPHEYPGFGSSDFRMPAFEAELTGGDRVPELRYESHEIRPGKPALAGLPATYAEQDDEAETLELVLADALGGLKVVLTYTVFAHHDAIARSARLINSGTEPLTLRRALSMSLDLHDARYELLQLSGTWTRERHMHKRRLEPGLQAVESRRGSSSHMHNPFLALLREDASEEHGDVFGVSLVYSGSFFAGVEVDQYGTARLAAGINPFDFGWRLEPGAAFQTPEAVLVHAHDGLGGLSRRYHDLYRERLCRGAHRDRTRPILVNNWEATYFDFDADKIEAIARDGKALGIELFVLDDGWFGKRDNDKTSLGDWFEHADKLPDGLGKLAERINALDMQMGLWFEPEMVSPDSELYRAHPDWCLHVPQRRRTTARTQLVLDLSRADVQDYIVRTVSGILSSAPIAYVKWDMNRNMTEIGSALLPPERQRETAHRYMLGLYEVLERITAAHPEVLFESCSGGGGRFDPGMLYYMPQTWTSDNTDAVSRLFIQYGTSIVYPVSSMGAHVSDVPNHQVGRSTSLATRGNVALSGNFGYELDLTRFSEQERQEVREQVALYKDVRHLVQFGDFLRLRSPFEGNDAAWMFVAKDRSEAFVMFARILKQPNAPLDRFRLRGLDPQREYRLTQPGGEEAVYTGEELMYAGLPVPQFAGDFGSAVYRLAAR
ncbi:alpha-galactosidase [Paenibacillus sp. IB182496]|uniref:Alpha-galactosidase n=1 Tax=Paenibacillus sabuli TaxID=2772509 RepID=A0A927BP50_9BACL|nr:alpha-galactosidase [Paenibacillus sabuli]MBD2844152.1 alpha-galactosidase [Paenibacillus sabuli]